MKADKAVCTNDTLEVIKYDVVFTTLIENKILAIKRDSEERKRTKKQKKRKSLSRIIFGKLLFKTDSKKLHFDDDNFDVERGENVMVESRKSINSDIQSAVNDTTVDKDDSGSDLKVPGQDLNSGAVDTSISLKEAFQIDETADDSNGSNENGSLSEGGIRNLVVEVITHRENRCYDDSEMDDLKDEKGSIIRVEKSEMVAPVGCNRGTDKEISIQVDDSLASFKDSLDSVSCSSSRATVSAGIPMIRSSEKDLLRRLRLLEAKSISAQCSPILPRQNRHSSSSHSTHRTHGILKNQVSYSDDRYGNVGISGRQHSSQRNINKSISRQNTSEDSANLTISTFINEADSLLYGSTVVTGGDAFELGRDAERKSKSTSILVVTEKSNKKTIKRLDRNSVGPSNNKNLMRDIISSFNQLTTTKSNYFPVITTTVSTLPLSSAKQPLTISNSQDRTGSGGNKDDFVVKESAPMDAIVPSICTPADTAKLQRMTSTSTGSSVAPTGCCTTTKSSSKEKDKRFKTDWETGQSGSDDEYRKRKRKYKRHHRCSDPVLVYPSSGGLQHCILSMPPNQPIEFHYNDDFVYDMTLQVEPDQNGDLQAIVPSHRSRHRHHRHKKRHRQKRPKILVHDLDTQSVKVIDPDDLPQRARWTIIATACLLLIMCLMLVGITLRMAPIIDDMGFSHKLLREIQCEDTKLYINILRMTTVQFGKIVEIVGPLITKQNTQFRRQQAAV